MQRDTWTSIVVVATTIATVASAYVMTRSGMPEGRVMAAICATFPLAAWFAVGRLPKAAVKPTLMLALSVELGFLALAVLGNTQVERAAQQACP